MKNNRKCEFRDFFSLGAYVCHVGGRYLLARECGPLKNFETTENVERVWLGRARYARYARLR